VQRLGHPGLRRHDLRHARATWFANAGVPLHIVRDILGHASIKTTNSYLHTDTTELALAAKRTKRHLRWGGASLYATGLGCGQDPAKSGTIRVLRPTGAR
jgi:hypothetical protein